MQALHQWKTLRQWHGSERRDADGNVLPTVIHDPGEITFIPATPEERALIAEYLKAPLDTVAPVEPDRPRLEAQGDIVDAGEVTLPVRPPTADTPSQPAPDQAADDGGEAVG